MDALLKAIEVCGSQTELARRLGGNVKQGHVWGWLNRDKAVPNDMVPAIERATDGAVRCEEFPNLVEWVRDEAGFVTGYVTAVSVDKAA